MRFVLDARTATNHFPGIGRYTANLARAIGPLLAGDERLTVLCDPTDSPPWHLQAVDRDRLSIEEVPLSPFSWRQQLAVPRTLRCLNADLYHSPYYLMPYRPGTPTLVTVHDLIPFRYPCYFTRIQRLVFAVAIRLATKCARRVIAVSQATADDLARFLQIPRSHITTIPEAADPIFRPRPAAQAETVRRKYKLPDQYVLYLGSNKPHKNLTRLVEAWAHVHPRALPLVVAGVWDTRFSEPRLRAKALALCDHVLWLGPIPDPDLPALYTGAAAFVFPSLYEGFGLPVLEAMTCGTPVACSNTSSLPEVAGNAALTFDPTDTTTIADALHRMLDDANLRADLRRRGLRRAARFSWNRTAQQTLAAYRQASS